MTTLRWIGSLYVGIGLMGVLVVLLVWGTYVEATYGTPTARFVLYDSLAFAGLLALVGINVFAAMVVRWRRCWKQPAFFAAHVGIVLLLVGSFVTRQFGEEATLPLFEGETGQVGQKASACLAVRTQAVATAADTTHRVPFVPGPQSWFAATRDAATLPTFVRWAAAWPQEQARATSFRNEDATIQVLDYLAATSVVEAPPLELAIRWERPLDAEATQESSDKNPAENSPRDANARSVRAWETLTLAVRPRQAHPTMPTMVITSRGTRETTRGGERVTFAVAESTAEVAAFRSVSTLAPRRAPRGRGVCTLWCRGEQVVLDVDDTLATFASDPQATIPLGTCGLRLERLQWLERLPMVALEITAPSGIRETLRLFADAPERNTAALDLGVYAAYWIDPRDTASRDEATYTTLAQPRLDLLQSPRGELFWRYWNGASLVTGGQVNLVASLRETFKSESIAVATGTPDAMSFAVNRFTPHDFPGGRFRAAPVSRESAAVSTARVKVRLTTTGGTSEECWLREFTAATGVAPERDQKVRLYSPERTVSVMFTGDVVDLGFALRLKRFLQQNEPGTRMAAGFTSVVDEVKPQPTSGDAMLEEIVQSDVVIRMNHPGTFRSAKTGRVYRVYQASRSGPFRSGDEVFASLYDGELFPGETVPREEIWRSVLSVNYDPGRGLKYLGCFLLIVGAGLLTFRRSPLG